MPRAYNSNRRGGNAATPPVKGLVISFITAVVAIVLLVLYYSLAQATITLDVQPAQAVMETSLTLGKGQEVTGTISQTELTQTKAFVASPSGEKADKATGKVMLTNNTASHQVLIATTRLLAPNNVLYRLQQTITVPAHGTVSADVIADQAGEASVIGPSHFTVPGLHASLQDKIYADSTDPTARAGKPGNKVTQLDLDQAQKNLTDALTPQALAKLREQLPTDQKSWSVVYTTQNTKMSSTVPAGTSQPNFSYTLSLRVTAAFYDPQALRDQVLQKLQNNVSQGRKVITIEDQSLAVSMDSVAPDSSSVALKVKVLAQVTVTDPDQAFNKYDLIGRTPAEVQDYFSHVPGVKSATVDLSPFWVKSVPTVLNHITFLVKS